MLSPNTSVLACGFCTVCNGSFSLFDHSLVVHLSIPDSGLTRIQRSRTVGSVAYTVFVRSRLSAPMDFSTPYTTPETTVEIGSTSANME